MDLPFEIAELAEELDLPKHWYAQQYTKWHGTHPKQAEQWIAARMRNDHAQSSRRGDHLTGYER